MERFLIKTKTCIPLYREDYVSRTALVEKLTDGEKKNLQLFLISAPPGYGKTSLILEWLKNKRSDTAWFSIDKDDNEPVRFFSYLIAALQKVESSIAEAALSLLEAPAFPPVDVLTGTLINEIISENKKIILVLDDFQNIHNTMILSSVQFLLDNQPQNLKVVIATRVDPQLSLGRIRARGHITEIREWDLRFTLGETTGFLNSSMKLELDEESVKLLLQKTEGWAAGLLLAALSLNGRDTASVIKFIKEFTGTQQYILDYLMEEMLGGLDAELREFLIKSSIFDTFNHSLCNFITGRNDSQEILHSLYKSNTFITQLNEGGNWYRFHTLFRDILKAELEYDQSCLLQNKALEWFEKNHMPEKALYHAREAGNEEAMERLILFLAWSFIENGEVNILNQWLKELPEETLNKKPELIMYKAWCLLILGEGKEAARLVSTINLVELTDQKPELKMNLLILQIFKSVNFKELGALKLAEEADRLLSHEDPAVRAAALYYTAQIRTFQGMLSQAAEYYEKAYHTALEIKKYFMAAISVKNLAMTYLLCGRRNEAVQICREALTRLTDTKGNILPIAGFVNIPLGIAYYLGDELEAAKECLDKGIGDCKRLSLTHFAVQGAMSLAQLKYALKDYEGAMETIRYSYETLREVGIEVGIPIFTAIEADFRLKKGDIEFVKEWAEQLKLTSKHVADHLDERIYLTYARYLITKGSYEEAEEVLHALEESAVTGNRRMRIISLAILKAVLNIKNGRPEQAEVNLEEAVKLASMEGFYRLFLEEDPCIIGLLSSVRKQAPAFVDQLLQKYKDIIPANSPNSVMKSGEENRNYIKESSYELAEPLSDRELEVLKLIAAGLSNKEISDRLYISIGTTKWHITNIFSKLGVKNRVQAIEEGKSFLS